MTIYKTVTGVLLSLCVFYRTNAQPPTVDFYLGYDIPVLSQIPEHFRLVNSGYQTKFQTGDEYLLNQVGRGYMWGLRLNFVSSDFELPLSLEYNRTRKINRSNKAYFPDVDFTGQYRMKYSANSVGFVWGKVQSPMRFGTHFDFGRILWKKKFYPKDEFNKGKWTEYTETISYDVLGLGNGPMYTGVNLSLIGRWKYLESRVYYVFGGKVTYPDYTNNENYIVKPNHFGFSLCIVPTRFSEERNN